MKITKDMLARETLEVSRKGHTMKIEIMPRLGANLCSFVVDGKELIYWSDDDLLKNGDMRGCFHMFPTPCRVNPMETIMALATRAAGFVIDNHRRFS